MTIGTPFVPMAMPARSPTSGMEAQDPGASRAQLAYGPIRQRLGVKEEVEGGDEQHQPEERHHRERGDQPDVNQALTQPALHRSGVAVAIDLSRSA